MTTRIPISARTGFMLCATVPSASIPKTLTTRAAPIMVETNPNPVSTRRFERRQDNVKRAQPRGNAPNPTRMMVTAKGALNAKPISAPVCTGWKRYREAISVKIIVGGVSIMRVNQGAIFQSFSMFLFSSQGWLLSPRGILPFMPVSYPHGSGNLLIESGECWNVFADESSVNRHHGGLSRSTRTLHYTTIPYRSDMLRYGSWMCWK